LNTHSTTALDTGGRCQAKYLTSAKFLTYYFLSAILLVREKQQSLAITFWMCVV